MFPGKESPWSVLGLDSGTATVRDVKRAYAKLLKQNRPDTNPEGFRRVHEAYTVVLRELELRDHPEAAAKETPLPAAEADSSSAAQAEPEKPAVPPVKLPEAFTAAM